MLLPKTKRTAISMAVASACTLMVMQAHSQTTAPAEKALETVVVVGVRASLEKSVELKRAAIGTRDTIVAEDIGKFPEANIADALGRLPGIEVEKDSETGEGNRIRMRGLPSEYMVTLFNGAPVRATSGANTGSATRDFNYDIFPAELFQRVDVYKTPEARLEEGGAAGVIDMQTPRPFDYKGQKITYSFTQTYNQSNGSNAPRGQALYSNTWGKLGFLIQATQTKSSQGSGGFASFGHFSDARDGSSLPPARAAGAPSTDPGGRQFTYDWDFTKGGNLNGFTQAQINSAFLPRLMRVQVQENDRERIGLNTSLQYKDSKLDVSWNSLYAKLKTERRQNVFGLNIRDSTNNPSATTKNTIGIPLTGTGSAQTNALVPVNVTIDANNNLSGTITNFQGYIAVSVWGRSETEFTYNSVNANYRLSDDLRISGQLSHNESEALNVRIGVNAENTLVDGVVVSDTSNLSANATRTAYSAAPGKINRPVFTYGNADPLYPTLSTPTNLLDPTLYQHFSVSQLAYIREIDKQDIAKADLQYNYELLGMQGVFKSGVSVVKSTKIVDARSINAGNILNTLVLPGGKLYSAATLYERAQFMQSYMKPNDMQNFGSAPDGFPRNFAVFQKDFHTGTLDAENRLSQSPRNLPSSYETIETVTAGYLQTDLEKDVFGQPLRTNVGVRYVNTDVDVNNFQISADKVNFEAANRKGQYIDILPSASLAYDVVKDVVFRAAVGKTIKRSSVSTISATYAVRGSGGNMDVNAGNPNLQPEEASSKDFALEWYFEKGGVLALSSYTKSFIGRPRTTTQVVKFSTIGLPQSLFTQNNFNPNNDFDPDTTIYTTVNGGDFEITGLELAFQKSFRNLPAPFNGLGMNVSLSENTTAGVSRTWNGVKHELPLVPKNTLAASVYWEQGPWFLRGSYNHKTEWASGDNGPNNYGFAKFFNARSFVDASFGYKFSKAFELRVDASNLTNTKTYEFYRSFEGKFGDEESRLDNGNQIGRGFSVKLSGAF